MTVLADIRTKLSRRKNKATTTTSTTSDHTGTQADRLKSFVANGWKTITLQRDKSDDTATTTTDYANAGVTDANTPPTSTRFRDASQPRPVASLEAKPLKYRNNGKRQESELLVVARGIQQLFTEHAGKNDQLVESINELQTHTAGISDIATSQGRLADMFTDHLDRTREQDATLIAHLRSLDERAAEHNVALGKLHTQLEANGQHTQTTGQAIDSLTDTLRTLADTSKQSTQLIAKMTAGAEQRDAAMVQMHTRTQKWMIGALIACGTTSIGAIIVATIAIFAG